MFNENVKVTGAGVSVFGIVMGVVMVLALVIVDCCCS